MLYDTGRKSRFRSSADLFQSDRTHTMPEKASLESDTIRDSKRRSGKNRSYAVPHSIDLSRYPESSVRNVPDRVKKWAGQEQQTLAMV
ncbi:hypothetical protein HJA86_30395 [Rhizobium bangladeshense]|nr:hypothetical protein [Rhizobium bangladeshense]